MVAIQCMCGDSRCERCGRACGQLVVVSDLWLCPSCALVWAQLEPVAKAEAYVEAVVGCGSWT